MEIIRLENIVKEYHNRPVLNHVSLSFDKGRSVAFVGHNGCGKSTLLKCIAGLIAPDEGKVVYARPLLFHYIPERFPPTVLTAREYLMRMGEMSGICREGIRQSIEMLGKDFFMEELLDTPMNVLSKGTHRFCRVGCRGSGYGTDTIAAVRKCAMLLSGQDSFYLCSGICGNMYLPAFSSGGRYHKTRAAMVMRMFSRFRRHLKFSCF